MIYISLIRQWNKKENLLFHQCCQQGVYRTSTRPISRQGHSYDIIRCELLDIGSDDVLEVLHKLYMRIPVLNFSKMTHQTVY